MRSHSPFFKGRGSCLASVLRPSEGWGLYNLHCQKDRDPTPAPPLEGRGRAAQ